MAEKPQSEKNPALSILRMEHVFFEELSFRREAPSSEGWNRPRLEITPEMEATGENQYRVSLEVLAIQEDVFTAKVKVCGDFSIEGGVDADLKEIVIKRNTMSILFPFVRSQMTLLTSQPEMVPVVLPAVNINAMLDQKTTVIQVDE